MTPTSTMSAYLAERTARSELRAASARCIGHRLAGLVEETEHLDQAAVEAWQARIGRLAPASRAAYLSSAHVFCAWLVRTDRLQVDPTLDVPRPRRPRGVPRALPAADVAAVLARCADVRQRDTVCQPPTSVLHAATLVR